MSGYERKIAKFTAHCTHTIKITRFWDVLSNVDKSKFNTHLAHSEDFELALMLGLSLISCAKATILKWKLSPSRNKRDDKFIAHRDGFELLKTMDVESDPLTSAKQQGHTNPGRLRTDWVDLIPIPCSYSPQNSLKPASPNSCVSIAAALFIIWDCLAMELTARSK